MRILITVVAPGEKEFTRRLTQGLVGRKKNVGSACSDMTDTFLIKCLMVLLDTLPSLGCPGNMQQWQVNQRKHLFTSG